MRNIFAAQNKWEIMHADKLRPVGGNFFKNAVASVMVEFGNRRSFAVRDRALINQRVLCPVDDAADYNDSFVFQGSAASGDMFMSRLGFRGDGSTVEVWVFLVLDGEKMVNEEILLTDQERGGAEISAGGLSYEYQQESDTWQITFRGRLGDSRECAVDLVYSPRSAVYLSSAHMDPASTGRAMAEMPWSRDYFKKLRSERQSRMEQGGVLAGTVEVDGVRRDLSLKAFRDHSWGKRNWSFINRYIWTLIALDAPLYIDGEPFDYMCYTTVDYGTSFRHLVTGWIAGAHAVLPIVAASDMHALAADGAVPSTYPIIFQPKGHAPIEGEIHRMGDCHSWMMKGGEFEVNESYCRVKVGGVEGVGMSEFGFSRASGIARECFQVSRAR